MFRVWRCALVLIACVMLSSLRASAQDTEAEAGHSGLAKAQAHFVLGMNFFRARDYREALHEFQLAATLAPNADIWFNIGRTHEELGAYAAAARAFERYLRDRVDAPDATSVRAHVLELDRLAEAERSRKLGEPQPGSLRIQHLSEHAQVFLDGQPLSAATLRAPLLLPAGRHKLDVIEPEHVPLHAAVGIEPGLLTAAYADLTPDATHPLATPRSTSHSLSYALFGVAGAAALVGGSFGALSIARNDDGAIGSARAWAQRADVALGGAAVCALIAAIAYYGAEHAARSDVARARQR
jgi:tetratricopeptide (TPR) repeat protein